MEKDLMKKKYGLPPVPPFGQGVQKKRAIKRSRDYTPLPWDKYFQSKQDVELPSGDTFRVYTSGSQGPVLLFLHGGGFSALSWALLTVSVTSMVRCRCVALDMRGHGDTVTSDDLNLSADQMSRDIGDVVSALYSDQPPPIVLVGHSMGGALAVHTALTGNIPSLIGLAVIDVVEGTAMDALTSMQSFLRGRPKRFDSIEKAIEWAVKSGQIQNVESARVSMAGQLKREVPGNESIRSSMSSQVNSIIEEEEEEGSESQQSSTGLKEELEEGTSSSQAISAITSGATSSRASPFLTVPSQTQEEKYTWRIDLSKTEIFWKGWFEGLSNKFLSCPTPKILILAGHDRLDKDLTIGQMQGKFQLELLPQSGHAVHEDLPDKVADILANFMLRYKVAEAV